MSLIKTIQSTGNDIYSGAMFSTVDDRCLKHNGCIVDLGCLNWDWSSFFIGRKRIIGVDPFENLINGVELFKGAISDFDGISKISNVGIDANIFSNGQNEVETLCWKNFCKKFDIRNQYLFSFHDWIDGPNKEQWKKDTIYCINKIIDHGYEMIDLKQWGWKLFIKKI